MKINISDMLDGIEVCEYVVPAEYDAELIKEKVHLKLCETKERGNKMEKKVFSKKLVILVAAIAAMSATTFGVNAATDGLIYEKLSSSFLNITISSVGEGDIVNEESFKIYVNDEEVSSDECRVDFKDYPDDAEPGKLFVWIKNEDYVVEAEIIGGNV